MEGKERLIMANGSRRLLEQMGHQDDTFREVVRCALIDILDGQKDRWKLTLTFIAIAIVPIVIVILDKVL